MKNHPPVSIALAEGGFPHKVFTHAGPIKSLEQAARERGQKPEQVVRSILFRGPDQEYIMVLVAGPQQIDWKSLRKHLGLSRITMATPEEVLKVTGYEIGTVAPFDLRQHLRILVDQSVYAQDEVSMGSGVRSVAIMIKSEVLFQALGQTERGNFTSDQAIR